MYRNTEGSGRSKLNSYCTLPLIHSFNVLVTVKNEKGNFTVTRKEISQTKPRYVIALNGRKIISAWHKLRLFLRRGKILFEATGKLIRYFSLSTVITSNKISTYFLSLAMYFRDADIKAPLCIVNSKQLVTCE